MTTQSLYRKHRPQTYEQVAGQDHVTVTLRNALSQGQVGHAYLFAGPRGTGKTSVARILAKAVNCQSEEGTRPCNACARCQAINEGRLLDLIEIDAASNRGIDEVRDLREKVGFVPSDGNYKVYILDEAHMLTEPAFNALLKTLEEPPTHVIFILVTTEAYKIPHTIRSRCQRFDFRRIPTAGIVKHLQALVHEEQLEAEPAALQAIAVSSTGSMRDAISLLDQLRSYGQRPITAEQVRAVLGTVSEQAIQEIVAHIIAGELAGGLRSINQMLSEGVEARQLLRETVEYLRQLLLMQVGGAAAAVDAPAEALAIMKAQAGQLGRRGIVRAIELFSQAAEQLRGGAQSHLPLELAFIEASASGQQAPAELPAARPPQPVAASGDRPPTEVKPRAPTAAPPAATRAAVPAAAATQVADKAAEIAEPVTEPAVAAEARPAASTTSGASVALQDMQERWKDVVAQVRKKSLKSEAALRSGCEPVAIDGDLLVLAFEQAFVKEMIESPNDLAAVEGAIRQVFGLPIRVRCVLRAEWRRSATARPARESATAEAPSPAPVRGAEPQEKASAAPWTAGEPDGMADPVVREAVTHMGAVVTRPAGRR